MPKINIGKTGKLLVLFAVKVVLLTVFCIGILSAAFSFIALKLDMDLDSLNYFSVIIVAISSYFTARFSISSFKNNRSVLAILAVSPLLIFTVTNYLINGYSLWVFLLKIALIVIIAEIAVISKKKIRV